MFSSQKTVKFKLVAALTLACFMWVLPVRTASAEPATIAMGVIALGSVIAAAGAVHYYHPVSVPPNHVSNSVLTTAGNIGSMVYANYAQWQDSQRASVVNALLTAKVYWADLLSKVTASPSTYPSLYGALTTSEAPDVSRSSQVNDIVKNNAIQLSNMKITQVSMQGGYDGLYLSPSAGQSNPYYFQNGSIYSGGIFLWVDPYTSGPYAGTYRTKYTFYGTSITPPPRTRSLQEVKEQGSLTPPFPLGTSTQPINSGYEDDITKLLQNEPNIIHYVDTATPEQETDSAPPYAPPTTGVFDPAVATPGQKAALNAGTTVQISIGSAKDAYEKAQAAAQANPYDVSLANTANLAKAAYDKLVADQAAAASALANPANGDTSTAAAISIPPLKTIDLTKLKALQDVLADKFPFSLVQDVQDIWSNISATGAPPIYVYPLPLGQTITIDLAPWDPVATACRYLVAILMTVGVVFYAIRRFV